MGSACSTHEREVHARFWMENVIETCRKFRCRWEDNTETDLGEIGWEGVD
jgi:hypothetical protein